MPRSLQANMVSHIPGPVTSLSTLWRVTLTTPGNPQLFFSDHDAKITYDGDVYTGVRGYSRGDIVSSDDMSQVDEMEIVGILDDLGLSEEALRRGDLDGALIEVFLVNRENPDASAEPLRKGWLGESAMKDGRYETGLAGLASKLQAPTGELYSPTCRANMGDTRCGVTLTPPDWTPATATTLRALYDAKIGDVVKPTTQNGRQFRCSLAGSTGETEPSWDTTIGNVTTETIPATAWVGSTAFDEGDIVNPTTPNNFVYVAENAGTSDAGEPTWPENIGATVVDNDITWRALSDTPAEWTAIAALSQTGAVTSFTDPQVFIDTSRSEAENYWQNGRIFWTSGLNDGLIEEVKTFDAATKEITLKFPMRYAIAASDTYRLEIGCQRSKAACKAYDNIYNMRAEPDVPGNDALIRRT